MKHILSLGAGVQSSTLLFLTEAGLIQPRPEAAIFADTGNEPESVYRWLRFLQSLKFSFPIIIRQKAELGKDVLKIHKSRRSGKLYFKPLIPAYLKKQNGKKGMLPRHCTRDYKIQVIQKAIRHDVLKVKRVTSKEPLVTSWIGISTDEADRMKPSQVRWIEHRWPLIDLGMSRQDCKDWIRQSRFQPLIEDAGFFEPPRSACTFCPYHSDTEWLRLQREEPDEFRIACKFEDNLQHFASKTGLLGVPYLHSSLVQLSDVIFDPTKNKRPMSNECSGICGV